MGDVMDLNSFRKEAQFLFDTSSKIVQLINLIKKLKDIKDIEMCIDAIQKLEDSFREAFDLSPYNVKEGIKNGTGTFAQIQEKCIGLNVV